MENERTARAALSRLFEPQDAAGLALVQVAGPEDALRIATGQLSVRSGAGTGNVPVLLADNGSGSGWTGTGDGPETLGATDSRPGAGHGTWPPCSGWADG